MKNILLLFCLFAALPLASAQSGTSGAPPPGPADGADKPNLAREATERLAHKYTLSAEQISKMFIIQNRKLRNLEEIESLKTSNPTLYFHKLKSVQKGTQASIRRMLTTEEQQDVFQKTQAEQRRLRAEKHHELNTEGVINPLDIDAALTQIYLE